MVGGEADGMTPTAKGNRFMKDKSTLFAGLTLIAVAVILASRPNCNRGCRTMAEHLIEHGISDVVTGLFA